MRNEEKTGTKYFEQVRDRAGEAAQSGIEKAREFGERAKDAASELGQRAKETASSLGSQAAAVANTGAEAAKSIADKAKDLAYTAAEKAKDTATQVAGAVGSTLSEKAGDVSTAVGDGLKTMAQTIRQKSPPDGILGTASTTVADTLESSGQYIGEHGLGGLCQDLGAIIRKNPIPALFVGFGLGFLIARATMGRRE